MTAMDHIEDMLLALTPTRLRLEELRLQRRQATTSASVNLVQSREYSSENEAATDAQSTPVIPMLLKIAEDRQFCLLEWADECLRLRTLQMESMASVPTYSWVEEKQYFETIVSNFRRENESLRANNSQLHAQLSTQFQDSSSKLSAVESAFNEKQLRWAAWTLELERSAALIAQLEDEKRQLAAALAHSEITVSQLTQKIHQLTKFQQDREQELIASCKNAETTAINRILAEATSMRVHYRAKIERLEERNQAQETKIRSLTELLGRKKGDISS